MTLLRTDGQQRRAAAWLFLLCVSAYSLTAPGHIWEMDGASRLQLASRMVDGFGWTLQPQTEYLGWIVQGTDGRWYSIYGLGQSLAFVPFVVLAEGLSSVYKVGLSDDRVVKFLASFLNPIEGALLCLVFFFILARHVAYGLRTSLGLSLILGFATFLWPNARDSFDHIQAGLFLYASLLCILESRRTATAWWGCIGGACAGFAILTRIDSVLFMPALGIALVGNPGRPDRPLRDRCFSFLGGMVPFLGFFALYNYVRFGNPMETGYGLIFERDRLPSLGLNVWEGLYRFLLSPGRGLLIYCPVVLLFFLAIRRFSHRERVLAATCLAVIGAYVGFFSQFGAVSPHAWGPRQLLPSLPMFLLPVGVLLEGAVRRKVIRAMVWILVASSILAQIPAVATSYVKPLWQAEMEGASATDLTFNWHYFAVQRQYAHLLRAVPATFRGDSFAFIGSGEASPEVLIQTMITLNIVDWWWLYLYWYGFRWALLPPLGLVGAIGWSIAGMRRVWKDRD